MEPITTALLITIMISASLSAIMVLAVGTSSGPRALLIEECAAIAITLVVTLFTTLTNPETREAIVPIFVKSASATTVSVIAMIVYLDFRVRKLRRMAHSVQSFGILHFEQLDRERTGTFDAQDVHRLLKSGSLAAEWHPIAKHLADQIKEVGHVVSIAHSTVRVYGGFNGEGREVPMSVPIYGVSREDLQTYHRRLTRKHGRWLNASDRLHGLFQ